MTIMNDNNFSIEKAFFKIIVPNYNNMPYIKKCLDSILEQTFQDFKIIVVDDISTDLSDKFCQMYARLYSDKIIFHQLEKKGYAGAARNFGINYQILSEYMIFIDSDDWFYNKFVLENLYNAIVKNNFPKLLRCPLFHFFGIGNSKNRVEQISIEKYKILYNGCGPARNCIQSKVVKHFVENRSKNNDVIWLMRTLDNLTNADIVKVNFPCQTYNRISITSCQNNIDIILSNKCIEDQKLLAEDLKKERFFSDECIRFQNYRIQLQLQLYKPKISLEDFLKNSYVISINPSIYQQFSSIFQNMNLFPIPKLHCGITLTKFANWQNCTKSHIQIVKNAKAKKLPYVCVFEDDAFPCNKIADKLSKYLKCIPYNANMILLGWSNCSNRYTQKFDAPFNKITQTAISRSHAYVLFESGYDKYLQFFEKNQNRRADNDVYLAVSPSYILNYPLFYSSNTKKRL